MHFSMAFLLLSLKSAWCEESNEALEIKALRSIVDSLSAKVSKLEHEALTRERRQVETVAFTAYLDHSEQGHTNSVLKFNRVLYNLGNAYNIHTGIFTVPITGTYLFSFQVEEWKTREIAFDLQVDGVNQVGAVLAPNGGSEQSGNTAILGLTKGQSVWIHVRGEGSLYGDSSFHGNSFAGAFLY